MGQNVRGGDGIRSPLRVCRFPPTKWTIHEIGTKPVASTEKRFAEDLCRNFRGCDGSAKQHARLSPFKGRLNSRIRCMYSRAAPSLPECDRNRAGCPERSSAIPIAVADVGHLGCPMTTGGGPRVWSSESAIRGNAGSSSGALGVARIGARTGVQMHIRESLGGAAAPTICRT